jgi:ATP-dependent Lhr-like helicase
MPAGFTPATQAWLDAAFAAPTPAQEQAWTAIATGEHVLVVAPTGSGKTLAAFLWALDRLHSEPIPAEPARRCRVLYVSPLKALAVDVDRNLRSPLAGIAQQARRLGIDVPEVTVATRTGDTPAVERTRFARAPSDVLITTPESLFLLLTSSSREALRGIDTVILDEVHAIAGTKRGAHLALSLERLDALLDAPAQRIGLSATVRPIEDVAWWMCPSKPATIVAPPSHKEWDLRIEVPVEDMAALGEGFGGGQDGGHAEISGSAAGAEARSSIWPHIEERLVDLINDHRATIVFTNSRRLAERITSRINDIVADRGAPAPIAAAHHGSVSRERRSEIEEDLKAGRLPAVVATSSLELGIDMGAVDVVIQVQTPPSVASGLQRVGRAGHQVGATSRGIIFPKYRGDLVTCAVVTERMLAGQIESLRIPRNPLDVLAQQIVAMVAMTDAESDEWTVDECLALARRSAPFASLSRPVLESVLDLLSGRYPSDDFASLKPRLVWDRTTGTLRGRPGAQRLAVTSGGTIPDRGLFGVFMVGEKASRVGELDEEMVYESRVGDVIALGASSWRLEQITHDRVLVSPAPGQPGRLPFWHGDALGRPAELGEAVGAFVRTVAHGRPEQVADRLQAAGLDERAAANLMAYLAEQREATGHLPDDRTIVIERFRDELGDWRVVIHSPFGAAVHAPWALAVAARVRETTGLDPQVMHADDGIVLRLPDAEGDEQVRAVTAAVLLDPEDIERVVTDNVAGSALFASRFREAAARALLLPRRHPGKRSPLWQQRQRSAHLLEAVAGYPSFPIVLETVRECLQDVYDVPALVSLTERIRSGQISIVEVQTATPSPFARSLLFGYVASFLYEGDAPLAERRAQALTLDTTLLAELLGTPELRDLLDPLALDEVEAELQHLLPDRQARDLEDAADLLRILGPLGDTDASARGIDPAWLDELCTTRRAIVVRWPGGSGGPVTAAIEDAARLRDALGVVLPPGVPIEFCEPVADPVGDLVHRFARTHVPFDTPTLASALGLAPAVAELALQRLAAGGRVISGQFRPGGKGAEWCDPEVLRRIRRRSVARLRHEAEPVPASSYAEFLLTWQQVAEVGQSPARGGADAVLSVIEQLAGVALPASTWESAIFPVRVRDYHSGLLDQLTTAGEVSWWGTGQLARGDGLVSLAPADLADALRPVGPQDQQVELDDLDAAVLKVLDGSGGYFFRDISDRVGALGAGVVDDDRLDTTLWSLAWRGLVTNDSWSGLRARLGASPRLRPTTRRGRQVLPRRVGPPTSAGRWSVPPTIEGTPEQRAAVVADSLLGRYGVVTRGSVAAERLTGGFAAAYRVLAAFEQAGRCQRAYVVEGLGAAQFGTGAAIDRLRTVRTGGRQQHASVLSAVDPANAYGAALTWPQPPDGVTHRAGRKPGAWVVLVNGELRAYLEKGGATLLLWGDDPVALRSLASAPLPGVRLSLTSINGSLPGPRDSRGEDLTAAGFVHTPSGWRRRLEGR